MEYIIASIILLIAIYIIYKNIKKSSKGKCSCEGCSKKCSCSEKGSCGTKN